MSSKSLSFWVRCAIIVMAICGITICAVWYPYSFSLIGFGFIDANLSNLTNAQIWTMLIFFWIVSIPCFIILFISWKISARIKTETVFTSKAAKSVKLCAQILLIDIGVFFIGNIIFLLLKINDFAVLYFFLIIAGLILSIFISVLSHYVAKAAELKELSDGTI